MPMSKEVTAAIFAPGLVKMGLRAMGLPRPGEGCQHKGSAQGRLVDGESQDNRPLYPDTCLGEFRRVQKALG